MNDIDALADLRQQEWNQRISLSSIPARLASRLGDLLSPDAHAVSVFAALACSRVHAVVDVHHPQGQHQGPRGPMTRSVAPPDMLELISALQRTCYHRRYGTWFQLQASVERDRGIDILVNDMAEPRVFEPALTDLQWQGEWFLHRRHEEHIPPWWQQKLETTTASR